MPNGTRGTKTYGSSSERLRHEARHFVQIFIGGIKIFFTSLTHHVIPQCAMSNLCTDIQRVPTTGDVIHIFGEGFPLTPLNAFI